MPTVSDEGLLTLSSDTDSKIFIFINGNEFISKKRSDESRQEGGTEQKATRV